MAEGRLLRVHDLNVYHLQSECLRLGCLVFEYCHCILGYITVLKPEQCRWDIPYITGNIKAKSCLEFKYRHFMLGYRTVPMREQCQIVISLGLPRPLWLDG